MKPQESCNVAGRLPPPSILNNAAVVALQAGRTNDAMALLQKALGILKDQFTCASLGGETLGYRRDSLSSSTSSSSSASCPMETLDDNDNDDYKQAKSSPISVVGAVPLLEQPDASVVVLYDRALLVDTSFIDSPDADELISAVVLFNMGLLHQSWGIASGKTDFLVRSRRLYEIAIDILDKLNVESVLLTMALWNNLAHLASHLARLDDMRTSLHQVRDLLQVHEEDVDFPLEEDDYALFFMNTMVGKGDDFTVAPAA